ncbi:MAG: hypothetical protein Q9178_001917 [Gyalolechia marmorata]
MVLEDCIPEVWARASILVRTNSLTSGHSGVRPVLVQNMKGSAESLYGPAIDQIVKEFAADVLAESSIDPIKLGPKEGLAFINGAAVSATVAALAIYDVDNLVMLSQVLTAMSLEALEDTPEGFVAFSRLKLTQYNDGLDVGSLRQDRYSIRTAPQWLGPVLEDLLLAHQQISIECNSATDSPPIETDSEYPDAARTLHGGNFQAKAVTSAMEKARLAVRRQRSKSFLFKWFDIVIAALQSELGSLSNPVETQVQTAETGNQTLNSLGVMSARCTHTALEVLSQLAAAHLFTVCQALDLRAMHHRFLEVVDKYNERVLADMLDSSPAISMTCEDPASSGELVGNLHIEYNGNDKISQYHHPASDL